MATLLELLCVLPADQIELTHDSGELIDENNAVEIADRITFYLSHRGIKQDDPDFAVGTLFSLRKLKLFIEQIEAYNSTATGDQKVDAVRIYKSLQVYKSRTCEGIAIVPTKMDDNDAISVFPHPLEGTGLSILANGTPCPNLCQKLFYVRKKD